MKKEDINTECFNRKCTKNSFSAKAITNIRISLFLLIIVGSGCNFLDFDESIGYSEHDQMYETFTRAEAMLTQAYTFLDNDFGSINGGMRDCATDDAYYVWSYSNVRIFTDGSWSAIKAVDNNWGSLYAGIRATNQFIEHIGEADFSRFEWNSDYENWLDKSQYWSYEARFLRAYFHFEMAKRYGDIPLVTMVYDVNNVNNITKTPFSQVIQFIADECDTLAQKLPVSYSKVFGFQHGRVTKGAAMALKSRALLYAASPLHNSTNEIQKWKDAALAAQNLMDSAFYTLDAISVSSVNNLASKELILEQRTGNTNYFEQLNYPAGFEGGNTGTCPTQNLVDAFQTVNGFDVTLTTSGWVSSDPAFDASKPYNNRDPRFYKTVTYDGSSWKNQTIEVFEGGKNGFPLEGATPTGYYLRKYLIESVNLAPTPSTQQHYWVLFRYSEVLLNYAEAMNEAFGSEYTDGIYKTSAREALNLIRSRANMPILTEAKSVEEFRAIVQRERRVEFALEGHRFWDIRRWKIGSTTQNSIKGVLITKEGDLKTYSLKDVENREWHEKMNLYPIPQSELYINPNLNPQNFGW
jgi:starch-binding outer membrane protein, SusD/RagB family